MEHTDCALANHWLASGWSTNVVLGAVSVHLHESEKCLKVYTAMHDMGDESSV